MWYEETYLYVTLRVFVDPFNFSVPSHLIRQIANFPSQTGTAGKWRWRWRVLTSQTRTTGKWRWRWRVLRKSTRSFSLVWCKYCSCVTCEVVYCYRHSVFERRLIHSLFLVTNGHTGHGGWSKDFCLVCLDDSIQSRYIHADERRIWVVTEENPFLCAYSLRRTFNLWVFLGKGIVEVPSSSDNGTRVSMKLCITSYILVKFDQKRSGILFTNLTTRIFPFEVPNKIFYLSFHTLTMYLYSYERNLVVLSPDLKLVLLNEFSIIVAFDIFGCRSPYCDSFEDMRENVWYRFTLYESHQATYSIHDD